MWNENKVRIIDIAQERYLAYRGAIGTVNRIGAPSSYFLGIFYSLSGRAFSFRGFPIYVPQQEMDEYPFRYVLGKWFRIYLEIISIKPVDNR